MKQLYLFLMTLFLLLPACTPQPEQSQASPMLRLQLLLTQAASLATMPGDSARNHALELARRAMSGSEMNAMHHGGGMDHPMMKATHDLGDAVFELLDTAPQGINNERLQLAAQTAQMRLTGTLLTGKTGTFIFNQGKSMISTSANQTDRNSAYDKAATHLLALLNKTG